ncbi:MAG TPA: glycoside hydrolase family 75 protein [Candidatus Acidoferrales bacterium]|nr:glycoside hydrolase family 75 protein [Candidatus Acidoferrales bacterium]
MLLLNFEMRHDGETERDIPIGHLPGTSAFFYESGMTIDADGAPNAYHPDNSGIDDLENAGAPGIWEGLAKDAQGEPFIQGPNDPFPGYYVSETALADRSKAVSDPARYVDASKIPFLVLPGGLARQLGARVGDFAIVFNERNGKSSYAIFGDVGPFDRIGEGSVALAENLGIRSNARNGGTWRGVLYLVFPGSGEGRPRTIEEINDEGQKLLADWETGISADACGSRKSIPSAQGIQSAN